MDVPSVLVVLLLSVALGQEALAANKRKRHSKPITIQDCGSAPSRPVRLVALTASPSPAPVPGRVRLSAALNISAPLPRSIGLHVSLTKYVFGLPFKLPCHKRAGTCYYKDVCAFLAEYFDYYRCPRKVRASGLGCQCPFKEGLYHVDDYRLRIPKLEGVVQLFALGEFGARLQLVDEADDGRELGCVDVSFHLRARRKRRKSSPASASAEGYMDVMRRTKRRRSSRRQRQRA